MIEGRESSEFTRFDGNLAGADGLPDLATGERATSPTALERYAICPHEYFVSQMLHVEPVEDPEELVETSVLDIGSIIHESFDALIREAGAAGVLPGYGEPWTQVQRQRLQEIANATADAYEAAGRTGHPLLWARQREQILATLDWMIDDDNAWRAGNDARVVASELAFGFGGEPAVEVPVPGGTVRFRGAADKIDERRDGTLLVTDIKTGSARTFKELSEGNPDAARREAPAARLRACRPHGIRNRRHARRGALLVRAQRPWEACGRAAHRRGGAEVCRDRGLAGDLARERGLPSAGPGEAGLQVGPVPLLQPRRAGARRRAASVGGQAARARAGWATRPSSSPRRSAREATREAR